MFPCAGFGNGFWWIFPFLMIAMIVFCFFMMRGHGGSRWRGCCGRGEQRLGDENHLSLR
jgi:hypothetical protein